MVFCDSCISSNPYKLKTVYRSALPLYISSTMASADFSWLSLPSLEDLKFKHIYVFVRTHETSLGKIIHFRSTYLLYLLHIRSNSLGLCFAMQTHPQTCSLIYSSCPSDRSFVAGFLQIPPHDGHPCLKLAVGAVNPRSGLEPPSV